MAFGDFTVVRNSQKRVLHSDGNLKTYAANEPAFEFNADGSYKGLLVEPAATNYDTASSTVLNWTEINSTKSYDQTTAPDGVASTADQVLETAVTDTHALTIDYTLAAGSYIFSCFVKSIGGRNFQLFPQELGGGGSGGGAVQFNLSTGTVASGTGTITEIGNGWYRVSGAAVTAGATGMRVVAYSVDGIATTFAGDITKGFYLWGMQVEAGPIATSHIPTAGSAVTRVKDDITLGSASSLIGQTEGTLYVEIDFRNATGKEQRFLTASDGTNQNRVILYKTTGGNFGALLTSNGTEVGTASETATTGEHKIAYAYKEDDAIFALDGTTYDADSDVKLGALATLTDVDLGQDSSAGNQANCHIRAIALFTRRLTNSELTSLTT